MERPGKDPWGPHSAAARKVARCFEVDRNRALWKADMGKDVEWANGADPVTLLPQVLPKREYGLSPTRRDADDLPPLVLSRHALYLFCCTWLPGPV